MLIDNDYGRWHRDLMFSLEGDYFPGSPVQNIRYTLTMILFDSVLSGLLSGDWRLKIVTIPKPISS